MWTGQLENKISKKSIHVFQKAHQMRFIHDILNQIEEAIINGKYREGDKLPSERELCDLFQTSRGPLREALKVLEQKKLITIKAGAHGGSFVKAVTTEQISESLSLLLKFKGVTLSEVAEFRALLESVTAALATKRASKDDLLKLKSLMEKARELLDGDSSNFKSLLAIDSYFHEMLAKFSRNRLFLPVLETVYANMHQYQDKYLPREAKVMRLMIKDLTDITAAMVSRDTEKVRLLMYRHVYKFNRIAKRAQRMQKGD
jgi:GntR family transcriptional regulator, transcriptional repressor for pyruvate dehydrogenase complex